MLDGVAAACAAAGIALGEIGQIIHGTTLATNALIERRGRGDPVRHHRGLPGRARNGSESRFEQYDLNIVKPVPLVRRPGG